MTAPERFLAFAEAADAVAATTKRLKKTDHLAAYLGRLSDDDLALAARYLAGRLFPLHDQRTVNVGYAALRAALAEVSGQSDDHLRQRLVALGDMGEVAFDVLQAHAPEGAPLKLGDVAAAFAELSATRGTKQKTALVARLVRRALPLEAKYLVKLLQGELRIGLREGGVEATLARLAGVAVEAVQRAGMLTGDLGQTALLARHGRLGEAQMTLFHPVRFMLATAAEDADDAGRQMPRPFAVEDKFDGIRAQAHVAPDPAGASDVLHGASHEGVRVALFSRTLDALVGSFPDLVPPLAALYREAGEGSLILDGEIVPVDPATGAIVPFQRLQPRLGRKRVTDVMQAEAPVAFLAFDLLYAGDVLLEAPFTERRARLEGLPLAGAGPVRRAHVRYADDPAGLDDAFDAARDRGNEGLMIKNPEAAYRPGRRGRDWLKLKKALATLDVVVTSVEVGHGKRRHLLSDFTFAVRASEDDPTLLNVGKAYSGLTDAELEELTAWFKAHTRQQFAHGRVRLVEPEVVLEVAFDRVQVSKRHKSGYALRFPRIVRLRPDKPVEEIDTLDAVRALVER